jgi:hypothetical protein
MRDGYKRLIKNCGGRWRLLYFDVDLREIRRPSPSATVSAAQTPSASPSAIWRSS